MAKRVKPHLEEGRSAGRVPAVGRARVTISIDAEVLEVFRKMAEAASISVGRCIGDWCGDTVEGAQFVMQKMQQAKKAPGAVMREMEAMAGGLLDQVKADSAGLARRRGQP